MRKYEDVWYRGFDDTKLYARYYPGSGCSSNRKNSDRSSNADKKMTVLCLHGLTRNSADFEALVETFPAEYNVIVPDQRGRGSSGWADPCTYNPLCYVKDMWRLLKELKETHVSIIGTSMGGMMAMLMVLEQPKFVQSVVLNDVGPEVDRDGINKIAASLGENREAENWQQAAEFCKQRHQKVFPNYSRNEWDIFARRLYRENDSGSIVLGYDPALEETVRRDSAVEKFPNLWPLFSTLKYLPLLVFRGENSDILTQACFDKMLEENHHPLKTGITVKERGHAPSLEEPEVVLEIHQFLAGAREAKTLTREKIRRATFPVVMKLAGALKAG